MPAQWNDSADKDLLLSVIYEGSLSSISWAKVASNLASKGYTWTGEACRQHYQKIVRQAGTQFRGTPAATMTPRKRKVTSSTSTPTSKTSKNNLYAEHLTGADEDDDEGLWGSTTSKRVKSEVKQEDEHSRPFFLRKITKSEPGQIIDLEEKPEIIDVDMEDEDLEGLYNASPRAPRKFF